MSDTVSEGAASAPIVISRRPRWRAPWIAAAVGAVGALLVWALATTPPATSRLADSPLVGYPAPTVEAETIDGESFRLDSLRGQWVLVNFFATWCVPCRVEHPELIEFRERHRRAGDAEVVGVIYDDTVAAVRKLRQEEGGQWPMLVDPEGRIALDFGVSGVPESYLIAPDGTVVTKVVGGVRAEDLEALLARARGDTTPG